jgi:hypothetical protein
MWQSSTSWKHSNKYKLHRDEIEIDSTRGTPVIEGGRKRTFESMLHYFGARICRYRTETIKGCHMTTHDTLCWNDPP